ncbi:MAG: restriction endonuclease [Mangrovibacterium sp.]
MNIILRITQLNREIETYQMSIPDFQSIMLPLLEATSNGKQWRLTAGREELARLFHLVRDLNQKLAVELLDYIGEISAIRDFCGTLLAHSAQKGIFITTSDFPKTAIDVS